VRFVVPYPPGGSTDPTARLIGTHLTALWGQQVVVENRAGGDTIIGSAVVAGAAPDGYTAVNIQAGMRTLMVPYKSAGPALTDLLGGHVQLLFALPVAVIQHVQRGALRGIAVSGASRLPQLPKIPTFAEAGMPKLEVSTWQGILAPARVPRAIVGRISKDVAQILAIRDVRDKLNAQGSVPFVSTPEQFAQLMAAETVRYAKVVEAANIRL
jgi:tripartite-type tricarboxylate transporter receptor subunit TctC